MKFIRHMVVVTLLVMSTIFLATQPSPESVHADAPAVVINELMYHPASEVDNDEFLELFNTTASPVNLDGWCFTAGISVCFSGVSIAAHDYVVISPNIARSQLTYSVTPVATYTGQLSNGGETLTLRNAANEIVNSISYDDVSPWPSSPDGSGPSLELSHPAADNTLAASWGASVGGATPNAENSIVNLDPPVVSTVSKPTGVSSASTPIITADVDNATSVDLIYRIDFEAEQTLTMYDDGAHGDGAASDGVYAATIPAQAGGSLVRYKIVAENLSTSVEAPGNDDTINYHGYVVDDSTNQDIPIIRWYMDPDDFTDMTTNHLTDDQQFAAVVAVDDQVFDNAAVRVKGQSTTAYPKKKFKFDLPSGHTLSHPSLDHPIDEFSLENNFVGYTNIIDQISWQAFKEFGFPPLQNVSVRVHKNTASDSSDFYGYYMLLENYDNRWRDRNDYEQGALYKQANDKKTRTDEDNSDIVALETNLTTLSGEALKNYLYDNIDIPSIINYHAVSTAIRHGDWSFEGNIYEHRDTEGTGRWSYLPWDLNGAFSPSYLSFNIGVLDMAEPLPTGSDINGVTSRRYLEKAMYQFPEFKDMYRRRLVTIMENLYKTGKLNDWFDQTYTESQVTIEDDYNEWLSVREPFIIDFLTDTGLDFSVPDDFPFAESGIEFAARATPAQAQIVFNYDNNYYYNQFLQVQASGGVPGSQSDSARVVINEIQYNPSGGSDHEYLELYNPNTYATDISGWTIDGISMTLPQGSVIPAQSYAVVVKNDTAFRAQYGSGRLVLGEYGGNLSNEGETIRLLRTNASVASQVTFGIAGDWPSSANGSGPSLSLIRTSADETLAACWAPSISSGTPARSNDPDQSWMNSHSSGCIDVSSLADTGLNIGPMIAAGYGLLIIGVMGIRVVAARTYSRFNDR